VDLPSNSMAEVLIPEGTFSNTTTVTIAQQTTVPPLTSNLVSAGATTLGLGFSIDLSPSTTTLNSKTPDVTVTYSDTVAQEYFPKDFFVARYDAPTAEWQAIGSGCCRQTTGASNVGNTSRDLVNRRISALDDQQRFSNFQLLSSPDSASILGFGGNGRSDSDVFGYPSPFSRRIASEMKFVRMPPGEKLRIYGLGGYFHKELTANANGVANWDVTDDGGAPLAPGTYIAVVGNGKDTFTFMVMP
jgi:hypothetical protein